MHYGIEITSLGEDSDLKVRARKLDEALAVLDQLLRGDKQSVSGESSSP